MPLHTTEWRRRSARQCFLGSCGSAGVNDTVNGSVMTLFVGEGNDALHGGTGNDQLLGDEGISIVSIVSTVAAIR
ncbi:hypothetical protein OH492_20495 [Vibrio chagasii]|nr:hypothetical protein [Vibrio chagasii]